MYQMSESNQEPRGIEALLQAAELLLADVQNERAALDRRERELEGVVAAYRARLPESRNGTPARETLQPKETLGDLSLGVFEESEDNDAEQYGAITTAVTEIMTQFPKKINVSMLSSQLELRRVPIRAKTYDRAVRTALRRLYEKGRVKRVGNGWYRLAKATEYAHA
jgi:hypothetical protein